MSMILNKLRTILTIGMAVAALSGTLQARDRGVNQVGVKGGTVGVGAPGAGVRDPGINQPGAAGNVGVAGVGVGAPGVGVYDPGINQPVRQGMSAWRAGELSRRPFSSLRCLRHAQRS